MFHNLILFSMLASVASILKFDEATLQSIYSNESSVSTSCSYSATCTAGGISGVCVSISAGCCSGTVTSNLCPGSSDIKCCTNNPCSTPSGSGTCKPTSACSGTSVAGYCTGPSDLQCCVSGGGGISRQTVHDRAQDWVNRKVPYSQTSTTDGYRQDCSGYVSMAWSSSKPGHTTYDMQNICTKITKSELMQGDAILHPSSHVLLFDKWLDSAHDSFMEYAEHGSGQVASYDKTSYSYYSSNGYFPCRYNLIK
jgi:cell wall-associated NlpC family hydrolase